VKGPGLRIDLEVRRIWHCAKCGKTVRTPGLVTAQRCNCSDESTWMRLEQPVPRPPFVPPHRDPLPEYGDEPAPPAAPEPSAPQAAGEQTPPESETAVAEAPAASEVTVIKAEVVVVDVTSLTHDSTAPATPAESTPADEFGAGLPGSPPGPSEVPPQQG
jgi:hypothetical protein